MERPDVRSHVATVFVIDPDPAIGDMAKDLLSGSELRCEVYSTCRDFLAAHEASRPGCVVLEQRIPDMSGLQLQRRLALNGSRRLPLVFAARRTDGLDRRRADAGRSRSRAGETLAAGRTFDGHSRGLGAGCGSPPRCAN